MRGKGPALFELMRGGAGKPPPESAAPPPPVATPTIRPVQAPPEPKRPAPVPIETIDAPGPPLGGLIERLAHPTVLNHRLDIPISALFLAAGAMLAIVVLVWVVGYRTGWTGGETQAVRDLSGQAPALQDPLTQPPLNPELLATTPAAAAPEAARAGDPRQAGLNYLRLAMLKKPDAEKAADFLTAQGLPAFAVPVDRPGAPSKNPGLYVLYASQGVTRDELKSRVPAVEDTDAAARRLGPRWKRDFRSSTDFADRYWDKYVP